MKVGVVGGGAVGLLVSANLTKLGHQVTCFVRRNQQKDAIDKHGLRLLPNEETLHIDVKLLQDFNSQDLIAICVKQRQIDYILEQILPKLNITTPILFIQNGMGHVKWFDELKQPILIGAVEHGALKHDEHIVEHTGIGRIRLSINDQTKKDILTFWSEKLNGENFPVEIEDNWYRMLAIKLTANAVINPLTALFKVKNGQIVENEHIKNIACQLCEEACLVLGLSFQEMWPYVKQVAEKTQLNQSSMLKDLLSNRKTENEAISGFIIETSIDHPIPYTRFVYEAIKALEVEMEE